jgi:hypothetical protein
MRSDSIGGGFRFLTGDVNFTDYGGKWYREIPGTNSLRFHVIELLNWEEAIGRDAEGGSTYNVDLSEVDLGALSEDTLRSAMDSYGAEMWEPGIGADHAKRQLLMLVECCHGYGCKAPLSSEDGNNWRTLMRDAVRESRALDDPKAHARAMAKPVNKIGSTAHEMMRNDFTSAMVRGVESGDPAATLLAKIYRNCGYQTLGGSLAIEAIDAIEGALNKGKP